MGDPASLAAPIEELEMESVLDWDRVYRSDEWWVHAPRSAYPKHFIRFNDVGCNIALPLDCTSEEVWLLKDDPNREDCLTPCQQTLAQWLATWLSR